MENEEPIRVSGRPRKGLDIDLPVQAILAITEQCLEAAHVAQDDAREEPA